MALIDTLLAIPTTPTEVVHVVRKVKYEKPNGAEGYTEKIIGDFTVSTQPLVLEFLHCTKLLARRLAPITIYFPLF